MNFPFLLFLKLSKVLTAGEKNKIDDESLIDSKLHQPSKYCLLVAIKPKPNDRGRFEYFGKVDISLKINKKTKYLDLDCAVEHVKSVFVNEIETKFELDGNNKLKIKITDRSTQNIKLCIVFRNSIDNFGATGIFNAGTVGNPIFMTNLSTKFAHCVFPCFNSPDLNTNFVMEVVVDKDFNVCSNMKIDNISAISSSFYFKEEKTDLEGQRLKSEPNSDDNQDEQSDQTDDQRLFMFERTPPLPLSAIGFVIGKFNSISQGNIQILTSKNPNKGRFLLRTTGYIIDYLQTTLHLELSSNLSIVCVPNLPQTHFHSHNLIVLQEHQGLLLPEMTDWHITNMILFLAEKLAGQVFFCRIFPANLQDVWIHKSLTFWLSKQIFNFINQNSPIILPGDYQDCSIQEEHSEEINNYMKRYSKDFKPISVSWDFNKEDNLQTYPDLELLETSLSNRNFTDYNLLMVTNSYHKFCESEFIHSLQSSRSMTERITNEKSAILIHQLDKLFKPCCFLAKIRELIQIFEFKPLKLSHFFIFIKSLEYQSSKLIELRTKFPVSPEKQVQPKSSTVTKPAGNEQENEQEIQNDLGEGTSSQINNSAKSRATSLSSSEHSHVSQDSDCEICADGSTLYVSLSEMLKKPLKVDDTCSVHFLTWVNNDGFPLITVYKDAIVQSPFFELPKSQKTPSWSVFLKIKHREREKRSGKVPSQSTDLECDNISKSRESTELSKSNERLKSKEISKSQESLKSQLSDESENSIESHSKENHSKESHSKESQSNLKENQRHSKNPVKVTKAMSLAELSLLSDILPKNHEIISVNSDMPGPIKILYRDAFWSPENMIEDLSNSDKNSLRDEIEEIYETNIFEVQLPFGTDLKSMTSAAQAQFLLDTFSLEKIGKHTLISVLKFIILHRQEMCDSSLSLTLRYLCDRIKILNKSQPVLFVLWVILQDIFKRDLINFESTFLLSEALFAVKILELDVKEVINGPRECVRLSSNTLKEFKRNSSSSGCYGPYLPEVLKSAILNDIQRFVSQVYLEISHPKYRDHPQLSFFQKTHELNFWLKFDFERVNLQNHLKNAITRARFIRVASKNSTHFLDMLNSLIGKAKLEFQLDRNDMRYLFLCINKRNVRFATTWFINNARLIEEKIEPWAVALLIEQIVQFQPFEEDSSSCESLSPSSSNSSKSFKSSKSMSIKSFKRKSFNKSFKKDSIHSKITLAMPSILSQYTAQYTRSLRLYTFYRDYNARIAQQIRILEAENHFRFGGNLR